MYSHSHMYSHSDKYSYLTLRSPLRILSLIQSQVQVQVQVQSHYVTHIFTHAYAGLFSRSPPPPFYPERNGTERRKKQTLNRVSSRLYVDFPPFRVMFRCLKCLWLCFVYALSYNNNAPYVFDSVNPSTWSDVVCKRFAGGSCINGPPTHHVMSYPDI